MHKRTHDNAIRHCGIIAITASSMMLLACTPTPTTPPAERAPVSLSSTGLIGNPRQGQAVFDDECGKCHQIGIGKNSKGPQLARIYGAPAAELADYQTRYSTALKRSGVHWDATTLNAYLTDPNQRIPNSKMLYDGLNNSQQRQDVIAYLATLK
ncbi:MAG: hypothetical protein RLY58_2053 [Pseudomonadota bacterium]|jgi:cytochrome c